jgi:hypothetical protein
MIVLINLTLLSMGEDCTLFLFIAKELLLTTQIYVVIKIEEIL